MMKKKKKKKRPGIIRYPWDKWLSYKRAITLHRGADYYCQSPTMSSQVRNAAAKRGLRVSIETYENSILIRVIRKGRR